MSVNPEYDDVLENVITAIGGAKLSHSAGALFSAFVGVCSYAQIDAGRTFEDLLSQYEGRVSATHRGSAAVN